MKKKSTNLVKSIWQKLQRIYSIRKNVLYKADLRVGIGTIIWASNKMIIGDNVYIGKYCTIQCNGRIGNNVLIANQVGIVGRLDHDYRTIGTTVRDAPWIGDTPKNLVGGEVFIGDDVWLGFGSIILSGSTINRGAIIAAGAVVRSDIPAYAIAAGVPAKVVAWRFNKDDAQQHEQKLYGQLVSQLDHLPKIMEK